MKMKVCKNCHKLFANELTKCPECGGNLSTEWQGYLIVIDPDSSEIAKKIKYIEDKDKDKKAGRYALKV